MVKGRPFGSAVLYLDHVVLSLIKIKILNLHKQYWYFYQNEIPKSFNYGGIIFIVKIYYLYNYSVDY